MSASTFSTSPTPFQNEPYTDFSQPANAAAMRQALARVRSEFAAEYDLLIAGERRRTPHKLKSLNPSIPPKSLGSTKREPRRTLPMPLRRLMPTFPNGAKRLFKSAPRCCSGSPRSSVHGSTNSTPGWCMRRASRGLKRTLMFRKLSTFANTMLARL